ncbi:hypothetical protein [Kitasatospora sp. NPDC089509]|uniref:hypothetical protein n=1 Tax=Kitasatospora sp. NPDC089509 TaxID=3364079 RepID=UPI0037F17A2E
MKHRQRLLCGSVVTVTASSLLLGAAPAASADSSKQRAATAAAVVERATGTTDLAASPDDLSVPTTSAGPVTAAAGGERVTLMLPATSAVTGVRAGAGTVVYPDAGADGKADLAVQPTRDGGIRTLVTIGTADAARDYRFDLGLPDGAILEQQADGSVNVVKNGEALGAFAAPWAKDANGAPVPTGYRLDGNALVQHIDTRPDTAYPVVADPWYNPLSWDWNKIGSVTWDKLKECGLGAVKWTVPLGVGTATTNVAVKQIAGKTAIKLAGGPWTYVGSAAAGCVASQL